MTFGNNSRPISIAANYAGVAVRYAFYASGAFVFAIIGILVVLGWSRSAREVPVAAQPAVQITAPELTRLPTTSSAAKSSAGWHEVVQYGQLYDRDTDFTLVLMMPSAPDEFVIRDFSAEMLDLRPISAAVYAFPPAYYDLETRFGAVRAASFQIRADGRMKLCLSYLSRFETSAIYYKGWFCETSGARPNAYALACMLDRLTLKGPLPSSAAQSFFDQRLKRSAHCNAEPVTQTTDTRPPRPLRRF